MALQKLRAGAGSAEIRFPAEMFPTDHLYGVHDAPHVGILVLEAGEKAAIVSAELVNGDAVVDSARRLVEEITGVPAANVWVHVTHAITTPHTPGGGPGGPGGPKPDPDAPRKRALFTAAVEAAVREAAEQAARTMQDASYGVGTGDCCAASNRDVETPFGWWVNINPAEKTNRKMTILRLDGADGRPLGFLMSYGIKPCAIDNSDRENPERKVSADVTGVARRIMEEKYGVPCLFCMSAAGDQVPREQAMVDVVDDAGKVHIEDYGYAKGLEIIERLGAEMGAVAVDIAEAITDRKSDADVAVAASAVLLETRGGRRQPGPVKEIEFKADGKTALEASAIRLGDDFALVAVKPEVNCQTERELWEKSPFAHTVLIAMVNGGMKYMPDKLAYERCSWEAGSASVMPGSAEKWVARAADVLRSLKDNRPEPVITAVAEPRPGGVRVMKAVVAFSGAVPADVDGIEVIGRTVTDRAVDGNTVTLTLSDDGEIIPPPPPGPVGPGPGKKPQPVAVEVKIPGIETPLASTKSDCGKAEG